MSPTLLLLAATLAHADVTPIDCGACAEWNQPQAPFRLHGDSWYVGTRGLSAVLVVTGEGLVLIDGGLPQSAPLIAANIESLGHSLKDIRWILNSHAHFDHAGGIAALQRMSGAKVAATPAGAAAMRQGNTGADDPQAGFGAKANAYPAIAEVVELPDRATVVLGGTVLTLHASTGHTPGGSSWTWRSCAGDDCRNLVFGDSLTAVSAPGYRFSADPDRVEAFRGSFSRMRALPCDLLVTAHPGAADLFDNLERREAGTADALLDPAACRAYADRAEAAYNDRLREEAAAPRPAKT